jgi:hypothetical protein
LRNDVKPQELDQDKLVLRAYSSEGQQLDGFQLEKKNGGSVYSELSKPAAAAATADE